MRRKVMGPGIKKVGEGDGVTTFRNGEIPELDAHILEVAEGDARYRVPPKHPKERVPRATNQTYVGVAGPRNLSRAGRIKMYLGGIDDPDGLAESARAHLDDARNTELPEAIREEHYDIAGARLWVLIGRGESEEVPPSLGRAFDEWLRGASV